MRSRPWVLLLVPALAACGGGTGSSRPASAAVRAAGVVLSVDGDTANLAQVTVGAPDADAWASCDAEGRFDLGTLPPMPTTLVVSCGDRPSIVFQADLRACVAVRMAMSIDGDRISRLDMEHCGATHGMETRADMGGAGVRVGATMMDGTGMMDGTTGGGGATSCGLATMHEDDGGHMGLVVEVAGFAPGAGVEVVLVSAGGDEASLGVVVADAEGVLRVSWDASDGDPLPFGATHLHDLSGVTVEARDATTGEVLFRGTLPDVGLLQGDC